MKNFIDGINFHELETQKYWSFPASYDDARKKKETREMVFGGNYLGAHKKDGAFYKFVKDEDGNMELIGRSKGVGGDYLNKIGHVPHLHKFFDELPNGTCFLGELYLPHKEGSRYTTTIMGCKEDKAIERQEKGEYLQYYIFDILAFDNVSWLTKTAEERFDELNAFSRAYPHVNVEWAEYFYGEKLWGEYQRILADGGEGVVITKGDSVYLPGKRKARQTLKLKKELHDTIDAFFTGRGTKPTEDYTGKEIETWKYWEDINTNKKLSGVLYKKYLEGAPIRPITKGYYNGWVGSMEIAVLKDGKPYSIGLLSGLPDEIKANPMEYKNRCIEVTAMQREKDTFALRHGKMIGWRDDLTIEDCTWEKFIGE